MIKSLLFNNVFYRSFIIDYLRQYTYIQQHYIQLIIIIILSPLLYVICNELYTVVKQYYNHTFEYASKLPSIPMKNTIVGHFGVQAKVVNDNEQSNFDPAQLHLWLNAISRNMIGEGKTFKLRLLNRVVLVICNVHDSNHILNSRHTDFTKAELYKKMIGIVVPHAMLITDGEECMYELSLYYICYSWLYLLLCVCIT